MDQSPIQFSPFFILYFSGVFISGLICFSLDLRNFRTKTFNNAPVWQASWTDFTLLFGILFLTLFISQTLLLEVISLLFPSFYQTPPWNSVIPGLSYQALIAALLLFCLKFQPQLLGRPLLHPPQSSTLPAIQQGIFSFFACLPIIWLTGLATNLFAGIAQTFGFEIPQSPQTLVILFSDSPSIPFISTVFFFAVIVAPIAEELVFRVTLYRFLRTKLTRRIAYILSAALFSLAHFHFTSTLSLFVLGILLARSYEKTGNPLTSITFHACFNFNTLFLLTLQPNLPLFN